MPATDEATIIDTVKIAVDDGRLPLLKTDAQNDPISEDLHYEKNIWLRKGKRLYYDNAP